MMLPVSNSITTLAQLLCATWQHPGTTMLPLFGCITTGRRYCVPCPTLPHQHPQLPSPTNRIHCGGLLVFLPLLPGQAAAVLHAAAAGFFGVGCSGGIGTAAHAQRHLVPRVASCLHPG